MSDGPTAEDRAAALDVLARFAHGIDGREWVLYRSVFTDEIDVDYESYRPGSSGRIPADAWESTVKPGSERHDSGTASRLWIRHHGRRHIEM